MQTDWADKIYLQRRSKGLTVLTWIGAVVFVLFWLGLFNLGAGI